MTKEELTEFFTWARNNGEKYVGLSIEAMIDIYTSTQSLLKKHQIFIDILTDKTAEPKFSYQINQFVGNPHDLTEKEWYWKEPIISQYLYKTHEECLEIAEQEALKLLP